MRTLHARRDPRRRRDQTYEGKEGAARDHVPDVPEAAVGFGESALGEGLHGDALDRLPGRTSQRKRQVRHQRWERGI
jgi:hypothetical protein